MQLIHSTSEFLKTYSKRYVVIRFICFFMLFVYGILNLVERNSKGLLPTDYVLVLISLKQLPAIKQHLYAVYRQFETARLIIRFFDIPLHVSNFSEYFKANFVSKTSSKNAGAKKNKVN